MDWMGFKALVADWAVAKDALHVYAAFVLQTAGAALLRRPLSSWGPWFVVLLAELANEGLDMLLGEEAEIQMWQLMGARHDLLNTMILPTALLLLCRYAPQLFAACPPPAGEARDQQP